MNITEFAAYAGVSKAAVSRFFNGGYLSAEKKAAIAKAVEETGYRPSMQAHPPHQTDRCHPAQTQQ